MLDNLEEMDELLETSSLSRQNQEETEHLNRLITSNEIKSVINKTSNKQEPWTRWLHR